MLDAQIIALASSGAKSEEISSALGLERSAVEFVLARHGLTQEEDIPREDYQEILKGIIETAKYSEHAHLKQRAQFFVVEQVRNRQNLKHAPAMNILTINNLIQNSHNKVLQSLQMPRLEEDLNEDTKDPARDLE